MAMTSKPRGGPIDRSEWPPQGPHRDLLNYFDRIHRQHGCFSRRQVIEEMSISAPTRVSHILTARNGTLPADEQQVRELIAGMGGSQQNARYAVALYRRVLQQAQRLVIVPRQLIEDISDFVGRSHELSQLDALLQASAANQRTVLLCAVDGAAGIGKSATAVHWAHSIRQDFPDGDLYVDLRGYDPISEPVDAFTALAQLLEPFYEGRPLPLSTRTRHAAYQKELAGKRVLIVLDNAIDAEHVRALLPGNRQCFT